MASSTPPVRLDAPEIDDKEEVKAPKETYPIESGKPVSDDKAEVAVISGKKSAPKPTVGFFEVFRYSTGLDRFLMVLGIIAAIGHGMLQPLTVVIFGNVIDGFANPLQYCGVMDMIKADAELQYCLRNTSSYFPDMTSCSYMKGKTESELMQEFYEQFNKLPEATQQMLEPCLKVEYEANLTDLVFSMCESINKSNEEFLSKMTEQIIYFIILGGASWLVGYIQVASFGMAAENQVKAIRIAFFRNLIRQDIGWYDQQESGAVTSKFAEDILLIHRGIGDKCVMLIQAISAFIAGMVIAFLKGWELALVVLSLSPLLAVAAVLMMKFAFANAQDETNAYAKAGAIAQEVLGSIRTVASFGGQPREVERYAANLDDARRFGIKKGVVMGLMMGAVFFIIFGSYALGFSYGIKLINDGNMNYSIGVVTTTFFAVIMGTFSLGMSVTSIQNIAAARSAAYNVFEIIDRKPPIDAFSKQGIKKGHDEKFDCHIELKNVHFRYPNRPDVQILQNVSLTVEPGTTVALVGASGCGKSTIIQLLQRFYDPEAGSVLIDGRDLRDYNVFWFRSMIGSVSQEPVLFGTSIFENIRYGYPGVSREEVEKAARIANAHEFILGLPKGYETMVGEQGAQLSGGQKQRIAIARALVRNPRILLLDEATSALDTESEAVVQEALDRARTGRTTIAIAHRLSTIMNADKIIVIDAGKVSEVGTHAELIARGGIYAGLVEAQQGRDPSEIDMEFDSTRQRRAALVERKRANSEEKRKTVAKKDVDPDSKALAGLSASEKKKLEAEFVKQHYSAKRLWSMATPEMPFIFAGTLGALLCGAVWPAFSVIFAQMMNAFTECDPQTRYEKGLTYSLIFIGIGFACFIGFTVMMSAFSVAGERLVARMRKLTFYAMLRQETAWFDDEENATGALASRLATKCGQVRDATGSQLAQLVQNVSSLLAAVIIAFCYDWRITLIMLAFIPLLIFSGIVQGKAAGDTVSQDKLIEDAAKYLVQSTTNIRTVTSLGVYRIFIDLFNAPLLGRHRREMIKINIAAVCVGLSEASMLFAYSAAFYAGAQFIQSGDGTDFNDVFTALAAIMFSAFAVGQANAMAPDQRKAQIAVAEIFKMLDRTPEIDWENKSATHPPSYEGSAAAEDVHFHYPSRPTAPILNGLSLQLKPGQTIALVGASGGGKSTVIQLLERFYDPSSGVVTLDGNDLKGISLSWARGKMSLVSQEPILFDRTIAENISYGVDSLRDSLEGISASMQEIEVAARMANIHDFIAGLPEGYNTRVGERGGQLSGGQKQRVAIARALIRQPQLLLLDEATSALDSESEKVVQEALDKARTGRTVLVIAHRLSTIEGADVIAVIQHGVVRELGTHSQLLASRGLYYSLWSAQQLTR